MKVGACQTCGVTISGLDDDQPLQCAAHRRYSPGEKLYIEEQKHLDDDRAPRFWQLSSKQRERYEERALQRKVHTREVGLYTIREQLVRHRQEMFSETFDPWEALQLCVDELDARTGEAAIAAAMPDRGIDPSVSVQIRAPVLIRFAILRAQFPELHVLLRSFTLEELQQLSPSARRTVMLLESAIDHYRTDEAREGRRP